MKLITSYLLLLPSLLFAQTAEPYAWDASTHPPQTARLQVWRGDTVPLAPSWGASDTNGWSFVAYWSTNNAAWWSKGLDGAHSVTGSPFLFTPDMDCGARKYRLFIQAYNAGGASFRANADVTMLDSPGATPAVLPAPESYPALAVGMLPYLLPYLPTFGAWTNEAAARASADVGLQLQIDGLASAGANTGTVSAASSAASALRLASADSNWWVSVESGTATLWTVGTTNLYNCQRNLTNAVPPDLYAVYRRDAYQYFQTDVKGYIDCYSGRSPSFDLRHRVITNGNNNAYGLSADEWTVSQSPVTPAADGALTYYYAYGNYNVRFAPVTSCTNAAGTYVTASALAAALAAYNPAAASNALAAASNALAAASNALAAAGAADARISAATNARVRLYFVSTNAWISVDFSNETVAVTMVSTNGTNTVTVGAAPDAIDPAATNLLWQGLAQGLAEKAPKDWGRYAPDGSANPEPSFMTWLNAPATVFASGSSWSAYGTYAVLTSPGTTAFEAGSNGVFRIGPDSTNWFGYVTGGSVLVGAVPDSIAVTAGGTPEGYAEIDYAYDGGAFPTLWFTPLLAADWTCLDSAVWTDNLDGTATVTAPAQSAAGFYRATTSASFSHVFAATMPARFDGGVMGGTNALPVVYDAVIQISSGGKTYRIPAQETH